MQENYQADLPEIIPSAFLMNARPERAHLILNERSLEDLRGALSTVPGAPGPGVIDEAIAAGWNFRNFQALSREIGRIETDLSGIPDRCEVRPDHMIEYLEGEGVPPDIARSLALTMVLVLDGNGIATIVPHFDALRDACAFRFDRTSSRWRQAVQEALGLIAACAPGKAWHIPMPEGCLPGKPGEVAVQDADLASLLRAINHAPEETPDIARSRILTDEDFEQSEAAERLSGGHLPITIIENVLGMCAPDLPDGLKHIVTGSDGVMARYEQFCIRLV